MIQYFKSNTIQEGQDIINTIIQCKGSKIQTAPVKTLFYFTNEVYGYVVVILDDERECLTQPQLDSLVNLPDGIYSE